jgi:hypothetical protein
MPDQTAIDSQQALLAAHRRTLAVYLQQQAQLGTAYEPPAVANGIAEARTAIQRIKATLREWGVAAEDLPDDSDVTASAPAATTRPLPPSSARNMFHFHAPIHSGTTSIGGEQTFEEVTVNMGDNINISNVSGSVINLKSRLDHVTQQIGTLPGADQATKDALAQLTKDLSDMLGQAPANQADTAEIVAKRTEALVGEVSKQQPDKELVAFNLESLKQAAANLAAVLPAVLPIATKIVEHISTLIK